MMKNFVRTFDLCASQTDFNARIRPGAILEIMQELAGAHAEALGIGRETLLKENLVWILIRLEVQMERYPAFGERITVETFPMPHRRTFFPRFFIFRDATGKQIGCASSLWALMNMETRRMSSPAPVLALMPDNSDLTPPLGMPGGIAVPEVPPVSDTLVPRYTDLDLNGHVNNTRYIDFCCNALGIDTMQASELAAFTIHFQQEILPGTSVNTELCRNGEVFSFSGSIDGVRCFDIGGNLRPRR